MTHETGATLINKKRGLSSFEHRPKRDLVSRRLAIPFFFFVGRGSDFMVLSFMPRMVLSQFEISRFFRYLLSEN